MSDFYSNAIISNNNQVARTNTTNTTDTGINDSTSQSGNSLLDKDAFLKLLLIEMQHQDPTDPMDTDKMLTQTSQLAALEMQQNTNTTMQSMVETMTNLSTVIMASQNLASLSALGKMAVINNPYINVSSSGESFSDIDMYLPKETKDGATFQVFNSKGDVVRSIKIEKDDLTQGLNKVSWDGKDDNGKPVPAGQYTFKTSYTDVDGGTSTSSFGAYPIESVRFKDGIPYAVMAGKELRFDLISEIVG